ncbi:conserved hypothetical protein [Talaromyces stipitatus ATCC 10500]|uniref:Cytochrome P450 n=1 Tax=Talaromyces stipitatus (strain ATCC 10500 / CBS 375.48 / QM 6759 / NRRL 1006) TaxID=441959 RepID=B8LZZ3_TALSN|nr:uncharacterized protein TSTA_081580 [Talaromyces stipitatus ATCC 10500]EED20925.1 conserved hypothetical protein [Talaromyces stipitatus ATCC 10500]
MYQDNINLCIVLLVTLIFITTISARRYVRVLALESFNRKEIYSTPTAKKIHGRENHLTPLKSRSSQNESLQQTFGIQNAFTSAEEGYVKEFVKMSRGLVNISSDSWDIIASTTQDAVERWKSDVQGACESRFEVELVPIVQSLTLNAVLTALFFLKKEAATKGVPFKALTKLAKAINDSWIMSKQKDTLIAFEHNDQLRTALIEVLPDENISNPRENPLNLILPGFETMWRIVLRCFLEVAYKTGKAHSNWKEALVNYSEKPTAEQFKRVFLPDRVSANSLVKEALRLYPPTKRIHRAWREASSPKPKEVAGDIEACHLSTSIWGLTAGQFDPSRWEKVTREQEEAFLPFGSKPFECPAKPLFGPRLVGLLVGTLLSAFSHDLTLVSVYGDTVEFGTKRLNNERSGCYDLYLELVRN